MDEVAENHRSWRVGIALGTALVGAYFLARGWAGGAVGEILYNLAGPLACVALVLGARRNRSSDALSWALLAGGIALFSTGDAIWTYYEFVRHVETPFPSVGDAFYVAGYPLVVAAFVRLARVRDHDRGAMIDAVVVGVASAVFIWFSFLEATLSDGTVPMWHRVVAAAYPAMDVPILASAALFLLTPGVRSAALAWLAAGAVLLISSDIVYARAAAVDDYGSGDLVDAGWLLCYVCWAVAALHPSMSSLTDRQVGMPATLTLRRLMLQSVAIVGVPFLILLDADGRDLLDYAILIGAVALLLGLNLTRLGGLIRASEAAAATLRASEARYRALVEQMPAGIYTQAVGDDAPTLYVNAHTERQFGYGREAWQADPRMWHRLLHPDDRERVLDADRQAEATGRPFREEYRMLARDGRTVWVREESTLVRGQDGAPDYWQGISVDITAEKEAEAALVATVEQFRLLFEANPHPMWVYELGTLRFLAVNDAAVEHYGYARDEFLGMTLFDLRSPEEADALTANLSVGRPNLEHAGVWTHRIKDGREIKVEITSHTLRFDGRDAALVVARDVTDHLALQDQLAHQAFHDPLTGLPNRLLFSNRLEHALARSGRTADPLAVLFIDLDGFKAVNDSLGHAAGDDLLLVVAKRLEECVRAGDTVGRLGGDEFIILLECADGRRATEVAERIGRRLAAPIDLHGRAVHVTASVGIACKTSPLDTVEDLLRDADVAMYAAKLRGKAQHATFDPEMHRSTWDRLELEEELRRAIRNREFRVFYQPILDLASGHTTEVEALVRWQHPERGLIGPAEFIPLAEETGLILPIGWWVLSEACRQVRTWNLANPDESPLLVAVNLSPRMFEHPSLVEEVRRILAETGLDPHLLRLEITEGVMMAEGDGPARTLEQLKRLGVRLAIDDFGTGYSSLAYLQQLPIDILKIDRGFICRMGQDDESMEIVRLIIGLAKTLGLDVVGEGIETVEQLASLRSLGGDRGQGYLFARPMPADEVGDHLFTEATLARDVASAVAAGGVDDGAVGVTATPSARLPTS